MKPTRGRRVLGDELKALKLRAGDRGRIKGEFEHHFFGEFANKGTLMVTLDLSYTLWIGWYESAKRIIELEKMKRNQTSETLDRFFETFFKVDLPHGVHITPELCGSWNDKHLGFIIEIWRRRSGGGNGGS